jgi:hypothetical protein
MRLDRNVHFDGDSGKHNDSSGQPCAGRDFQPTMVGVGGVYTNEVRCLMCGKELRAYEDRLSAA